LSFEEIYWNERGYEGLVPNFSGGPKPKLGDAEREDLKRMVAEKMHGH